MISAARKTRNAKWVEMHPNRSQSKFKLTTFSRISDLNGEMRVFLVDLSVLFGFESHNVLVLRPERFACTRCAVSWGAQSFALHNRWLFLWWVNHLLFPICAQSCSLFPNYVIKKNSFGYKSTHLHVSAHFSERNSIGFDIANELICLRWKLMKWIWIFEHKVKKNERKLQISQETQDPK